MAPLAWLGKKADTLGCDFCETGIFVQSAYETYLLSKGTYWLNTNIQSSLPDYRTYRDTIRVKDGITFQSSSIKKAKGEYELSVETFGDRVTKYEWFQVTSGQRTSLNNSTKTILVTTWNNEQYRVVASASSGCIDSVDFSIQVNPTGLTTASIHTHIYPNPANNLLTVQLENGMLSSLRIWGIDGKLQKEISTISANKYLLDTNDTPNGIYLLECILEDGSHQFIRTLIQH